MTLKALPFTPDTAALARRWGWDGFCAHAVVEPYDDGVMIGTDLVFSGCLNADPQAEAHVVAASSPGQPFTALLHAQIPGPQQRPILDGILATFKLTSDVAVPEPNVAGGPADSPTPLPARPRSRPRVAGGSVGSMPRSGCDDADVRPGCEDIPSARQPTALNEQCAAPRCRRDRRRARLLTIQPASSTGFDRRQRGTARRRTTAPTVGCKGYRRVIAALDGRALNTLKVDADLERVAADFHDLLDSVTCAELRAPTNGTKWTNEQLLFHMLFGFLLVRALLPIVKGFGRLPDAVSHGFAATLNAATRPFHVVNYLSALPGGRVLRGPALGRLVDSTVGHLRARLARESARTLALAMHFPTGWDPYFKDVMTIADVYAYPTQHYDHHRRQLTTRRALDI